MELNISKLNLMGHDISDEDIEDVLFEKCNKEDLTKIIRFLKKQKEIFKDVNRFVHKENCFISFDSMVVRPNCTIKVAMRNFNANTPDIVGDSVEALIVVETDMGNFQIKSSNNNYGGCNIEDFQEFITILCHMRFGYKTTTKFGGDIDN